MSAAEKKYVLVVDDEPDVRSYLAAILEDSGYEVGSAGDGKSALEMVEERAPDLISLDLVMPGKSGARFLYALRKNREWARIPVIIVTGHAHDEAGREDIEDLLAGKAISGPETCLEKPVTPEGYVSAVRRQLGLTVESSPAPVRREAVDVRAELHRALEGADAETMRKLLRMLKEKGAAAVPAEVVTGKRVLIIDDEVDVSSYLSALLTDQGYVAATANDPDEGLRMAREDPPDLITLDIDMPGKSGMELYREIRAHDALREVPVVVVTGIQQDLRPLFSGSGGVPDVDGYIHKPFEPELLFATVEDAIARRQA
jgi:CheY-like chemotaxis protein